MEIDKDESRSSINNNNNNESDDYDKIVIKPQKITDINVIGYVSLRNLGSSEAGYKFYVTGGPGKSALEMITISLFSLPTACPWIEYDIVVRKKQGGSLYDVMRVRNCKQKPVTKASLLDYLIDQRRNMISSASKGGTRELGIDQEISDYKKFVKKCIKKLPDTINSIKDIDDMLRSLHSSADTPKPIISKAENIAAVFKRWLKPCFKGPIFLTLLRYFDASLLLKLDKNKKRALYAILMKNPLIFCFWDYLLYVLSEIKFDKGLLFDLKSDGLSSDSSYCHIRYNNMINLDDTVPLSYSNRFPMWDIKRLKQAYEDLKINMPVSIDIIRNALVIYLEMEKNFYNFGNTCFVLGEIMESFDQQSVKFLIDNNIVNWALRDYSQHSIVIKPTIHIIETRIAYMIENKIHRMDVYDCGYYNDTYASYVMSWLLDKSQHDGISAKDMLLFSANESSATFMSNRGHMFINVKYSRTAIKERTERYQGRTLHIVIDRLHKLPMEQFYLLLESISNISKDKTKGGAILYLFGDTEDYPVHSRRGGGNLMSDIWNTICTTGHINREVKNLHSNKDPMYRKVEQIKDFCMKKSNKLDIVQTTNWKAFVEKLKKLDRSFKDDKTKSKSDFIIFCSNDEDRDVIMDIVFKKRTNPNGSYKKKEFFVSQKVHITDIDVVGTIEKMWTVQPYIRRGKTEVSGKSPVNITYGDHIFQINGLEYNTQDYSNIVHADVQVVSKFAGPPASEGVFLIGEKTNMRHMICAAKYCSNNMEIYTMPNVDERKVSDVPTRGIQTDLSFKLGRIKFKIDKQMDE